MFCTNCGKELKEDEIFCPNCGTKNAAWNDGKAGGSFADGKAEPVMWDEVGFSPAPVQAIGKKPHKTVLILGIAAALVLCAGIFLGLRAFLGNIGGAPNQAMYIKDQEIFVKDLSKDEPQQISTRFLDASQDETLDLLGVSSRLQKMCTISDDGSIAFFADKYVHLSSSSAESYSLYYKKLKNPKEEPVKIDSDVYSYQVNSSATLVTYQKGTEETLYQYDMKTGEKEKIGNNMLQFSVSEDGEKIVYRDSEDRLYLKIRGEEKKKIDNNVAYFPGFRVSYELNYVCYGKNGTLYKMSLDGGERTDLASYESMTFFFFYEETGEAYYLDDNRLYYYDGTDATWISEGEYVDSIGYNNVVASKTPVIIFKTQSIDNIAWHIAVKGDVYDFPDVGEYLSYLSVDPNGSCVYYLENVTEGSSLIADLYKVEIVEGIPQEPVLFDEGMSVNDPYFLRFVAPGKFAYYRDVMSGYYDLYINGEPVDYGVRGNFFGGGAPGYYAELQSAIYYTDWDQKKLCGTLRMCKEGEEPVTIAEDVHDFTVLPSGDILYLYDFSSNSSCLGDLGVYRNGETETVDVDVSGIVPMAVNDNDNYRVSQNYSNWSY